jgi:photoactive yellow protein
VQGWGLSTLFGNVGSEIDLSPPGQNAAQPVEAMGTVIERIDDYSERQLDQLPFGVIQLAPDGTVLQYNRFEENLAGFKTAAVVGRNFFSEVAPCTDVQDFAGRFRNGVAVGSMHTTFDFVFTFNPPKNVRITLYLSQETGTIWVFVQED